MSETIRTKLWHSCRRKYFPKYDFNVSDYRGSDEVDNVLSLMTGQRRSYFKARIDKNNPMTWSSALWVLGLKLIVCPTEFHKLKFYLDELLMHDDLFLICHYSKKLTDNPQLIFSDSQDDYIYKKFSTKILHRNRLIDVETGTIGLVTNKYPDCYIKWICRVVPFDYSELH
jgi:hypothetical protein